MLVELNYVFFSFVLLLCSILYYLKRKNRYLLYLTLCFTFLMLSNILQVFISMPWILGIAFRFLELGALALYACFTICTIITLRIILKKSVTNNPSKT